MDVDKDSHAWTMWQCYRPGSCSGWLSDTSWIICRWTPEQLRENKICLCTGLLRPCNKHLCRWMNSCAHRQDKKETCIFESVSISTTQRSHLIPVPFCWSLCQRESSCLHTSDSVVQRSDWDFHWDGVITKEVGQECAYDQITRAHKNSPHLHRE